MILLSESECLVMDLQRMDDHQPDFFVIRRSPPVLNFALYQQEAQLQSLDRPINRQSFSVRSNADDVIGQSAVPLNLNTHRKPRTYARFGCHEYVISTCIALLKSRF